LSKTLEGRITSWNAASEQLFGFSATEMNDQSVFRLIPEYLHDEEADLLQRVGTGEHIDRYETIRVNKAGKLLNVSVTLSPVRDGAGQISGASTIIRDMSEQQRANEAEALLAAIVKSSYDPIVSKVLNGIVSSWNAAAETVFGFSPDEMIGQSIRKIIPADRQARLISGRARRIEPLLNRVENHSKYNARQNQWFPTRAQKLVNRAGARPPASTATRTRSASSSTRRSKRSRPTQSQPTRCKAQAAMQSHGPYAIAKTSIQVRPPAAAG
jgi:PAS domain S-box-containing protein